MRSVLHEGVRGFELELPRDIADSKDDRSPESANFSVLGRLGGSIERGFDRALRQNDVGTKNSGHIVPHDFECPLGLRSRESQTELVEAVGANKVLLRHLFRQLLELMLLRFGRLTILFLPGKR